MRRDDAILRSELMRPFSVAAVVVKEFQENQGIDKGSITVDLCGASKHCRFSCGQIISTFSTNDDVGAVRGISS